MTHRRRTRLMRGLAAAAAMACAAAPPAGAQQQQSGVAGMVRTLTGGLRDFVAGPPPPVEQVRRGLRPCGSLYGPDAREIARGPELLASYERWVRASYDVISEIGPLPVCFDPGRDTLTTNQGRYLLAANNYYLRRYRNTAFVLTGYSDPQEADGALALRRAEVIQAQSTERRCRYRPRRGSAQVAVLLYRTVEYSRDPAAYACPTPPPP
jgi:outer membrane protein OmpA-like peptidoglycan-associated protein